MLLESTCLNCDNTFKYNPNHKRGKYCCCQCASDGRKKLYINEWILGKNSGGNGFQLSNHIRHYLLEQTKHKCPQCGWGEVNLHTGKVPLEIDHIDDDPFNHSYNNLQVLCPNCHSLKTKAPSKSKGGRYKNKTHPKYTILPDDPAREGT
jgi:hypothetical protein